MYTHTHTRLWLLLSPLLFFSRVAARAFEDECSGVRVGILMTELGCASEGESHPLFTGKLGVRAAAGPESWSRELVVT